MASTTDETPGGSTSLNGGVVYIVTHVAETANRIFGLSVLRARRRSLCQPFSDLSVVCGIKTAWILSVSSQQSSA